MFGVALYCENTMGYWQLYFRNKFGDPNFGDVKNIKAGKFQQFFTSERISKESPIYNYIGLKC